jgi:hypothetical protein
MAKKSKTRSYTPASTHFPTLRQAAGLYYTSGGETPEPWRSPEPAAGKPRSPKRDTVFLRVRAILADLDREGVSHENLRPCDFDELIDARYSKQYPADKTHSPRTYSRARRAHAKGLPVK